MSVGDLNQVVRDLDAKIVIPINYKTDSSGILNLRPLDEYLDNTKFRCAISIRTSLSSPALHCLTSRPFMS